MKDFYKLDLWGSPLILDSEIADFFVRAQAANLFLIVVVTIILFWRSKHFLINLIFILSIFSLIASAIHQIFFSISFILSFLSISIIIFGYWKNKIVSNEEITYRDKKIYFSSFFIAYIFSFIVKLYSFTVTKLDIIPISHTDEIFYALTASLIDNFKIEITPPYANNLIFGSKKSFWFYHYYEVYLIILLKRVINIPYFFIYQFIIWPFFHALGFMISVFVLNRSFKISAYVSLFLALSVLLTLRFNLLDEYFFNFFDISTKGNSFFQNYGNSHFLSYWSGLKHAFSLVTLLPVVYFGLERKYYQLIIAGIFALLVTPVNAPILFIFIGILLIHRHRLFLFFAKLLVIISLFIVFWLSSGFKSGLLTTVNFIFENNYWAILPISLICLYNYKSISIKYRICILIWVLFPLVYLHHKILFPLFMIPNLFLVVYFIWKDQTKERLLFVLLAASLYCLSKIAATINFESTQVFNNYSQLITLLLIGSFIYAKDGFKIGRNLVFTLVIYIFFVGTLAIFYDAKIPMKYEEYSQSIQLDSSKFYKALSISEFSEPPFLFRSTLGYGIITRNNNFANFAVGFEFIDPILLDQLMSSLRILKNDYFYINKNTLGPSSYYKLVDQGLVDIIMVENKEMFLPHSRFYEPRAKKIIQEKEREYTIFIFR